MSVFMWEGLLTNRTDEVFTHGTIPFLQGMDFSWYEMLSQRDGTLLHTAKYCRGHFKSAHSWLNFEPLRLFCLEYGVLGHQMILILIVLIFCVDFLRIMFVAIVHEALQIWEVKDARSPEVLVPMVWGGHCRMLYCVYFALRWTVDMNTHTHTHTP